VLAGWLSRGVQEASPFYLRVSSDVHHARFAPSVPAEIAGSLLNSCSVIQFAWLTARLRLAHYTSQSNSTVTGKKSQVKNVRFLRYKTPEARSTGGAPLVLVVCG
jgi:hypothetical protein